MPTLVGDDALLSLNTNIGTLIITFASQFTHRKDGKCLPLTHYGQEKSFDKLAQ